MLNFVLLDKSNMYLMLIDPHEDMSLFNYEDLEEEEVSSSSHSWFFPYFLFSFFMFFFSFIFSFLESDSDDV